MPPEPAPPTQTPAQIATILEDYLSAHPATVVLEDGQTLFDLKHSKYSLTTDHHRCTLHLWNDDRNLVRRILSATPRQKSLRLATLKFGQTKPQSLELNGTLYAVKDRRTPSSREATRTRFLRILERALPRHFPGWQPHSFRTAMDLEKSFGPAYARGLLVQGTKAWAVIAVNPEESPATIDAILTFGILWLHACRTQPSSRRNILGLKLILPAGAGTLTLARLPWLAGDSLHPQWQLLELDPETESLTPKDPTDQGNVHSHLLHLADTASAQTRFAPSIARVLACIPAAMQPLVEQRLRSGAELAFLLHGLEFARIRSSASTTNFNQIEQITFGAAPSETPLTDANSAALSALVASLCERRNSSGTKTDILYRLQPERWLESLIRRNPAALDDTLDPHHVHSQVPAFAAADRGMLDLLAVSTEGRLAVIELKAEEDPQLALQGLDYWIRVRHHHAENPNSASPLGDFQRHGYFPGLRLSPAPPRLYLVAPALRIHPATEIVLRHLAPRVDWHLLAIDERWRQHIKVIWRKRSTDPTPTH